MQQIQTLNETQKILTLGWIINGLSGKLVSPPEDMEALVTEGIDKKLNDSIVQEYMESVLTEDIDKKLNNPTVQGYIGNWQRVWGPFVYLAPPPFNKYATNAIYVARQGNQYVIGIAGTNFKSIHNWFIEDFYVTLQADWYQYAEKQTQVLPRPKISLGTKIGLDNLLKQHEGSGTTIIEFLTNELKEAGDNIEIVVTGHSLGGALSPVLALALYEKKSTWDPNSRATLKVYPFAGPTPGNVAFSEYYGERLGNNTTRVWNSLDIVPHAWGQLKLSQIPKLYEPNIPSNPLIERFVNLAKRISLLGSYTHIKALTPALKGTFRPPVQTPETSAKEVELNVQLSDSIKSAVTTTEELSALDENNGFEQFMGQALEQHIAAYFDLLEFPLDLKELLLPSSQPDPDATESMVVKLLEYSANTDIAH